MNGVLVECSLFYYLGLKNAKVPAEMHLYPRGGPRLRACVRKAKTVSTWPESCRAVVRSARGAEEPKAVTPDRGGGEASRIGASGSGPGRPAASVPR